MTAYFFKFFSSEIGVSETTGYDWTKASSEAKQQAEQFHVETIVKPRELQNLGKYKGYKIILEIFFIMLVIFSISTY